MNPPSNYLLLTMEVTYTVTGYIILHNTSNKLNALTQSNQKLLNEKS